MLYDYASPNRIYFKYRPPVKSPKSFINDGDYSAIFIRTLFSLLEDVSKKSSQKTTNFLKIDDLQIDEVQKAIVKDFEKKMSNGVDRLKYQLNKELIKHPFISEMVKVRGVSSANVAKIMVEAKNPQRFETHSQFHIYCGVAPKHGLFPSKWTLETLSLAEKILFVVENTNLIDYFQIGKVIERIMKERDYADLVSLKDYKEIKEIEYEIYKKSFGYNRTIQSMLYFMGKNFMINKGFFYEYYLEKKEEILRSENEKFVYDEEKKKHYVEYVKIKRTKSEFAHSGAFWRMMKLYISLFYNEWNRYEGIDYKKTFSEEFISERHLVTLEEVINFGGY